MIMSETALSQEQINEIIAALRSKGKRKMGFKRARPTPEETELRRKANDEECFRKFTAQGYKDVKPRINVLTFGKWAEKGRQVRKGEKGTAVGPFNLFHEDQTDPIIATPSPTPAATVTAVAETKKEAGKTEAATASWTDWNS